MKCKDLIHKLEELSPSSFALAWDNSGLAVGETDKNITSVMLALDVTEEVIEEAIQKNSDMILTHHPMIFGSIKNITDESVLGRKLISVIRNRMVCYSMHTNFDVMGMADAAADRIRLREREVLDVTYEDEISKEGIGRYGTLSHAMSLRECAQIVKEAFELPYVRVFGDAEATIVTAAISTGSGKDMIQPALRAGVDVLITGDIGYHAGLDAVAEGLQIIDAGHFGLEKIFIGYMQDFFGRELPEIQVFVSKQGEAEQLM